MDETVEFVPDLTRTDQCRKCGKETRELVHCHCRECFNSAADAFAWAESYYREERRGWQGRNELNAELTTIRAQLAAAEAERNESESRQRLVLGDINELQRELVESQARERVLWEALTDARDAILSLRLHGGKLSNCCFNSAQAGGFSEAAVAGVGESESRKRVVRVLRESVKAWDEIDKDAGDLTKRLRAALATPPGEAVAKLLAEERERISIEACSRLCERCELNIPVEFTGKEWRHLHGGWSVLCYASPIRSAIRALPATPATESEGV
jgi:hypothetical protein